MQTASVYVDPQIQKVRDLYADVITEEFYSLPVRRQLALQARRLVQAHADRSDAVCFQIGSWHPRLTGVDEAELLAHAFGIGDGQATIAREYGFSDWPAVESLGVDPSSAKFERAVNTMLEGDLALLETLLSDSPELISARSHYGHQATLLHYVGTNGVESYRQVVPSNLAVIVELLIARGADPGSTANIYGGSTPRQLFETSKHSRASGALGEVLAIFERHERKRDRH